ncbi:MAG: hypothetical protein LBC85_07625 [Fibromonadaceae bacterium]|jgi:hypothetical protein|nr:hypothetical protein [Fibromonadaceae bacterium]
MNRVKTTLLAAGLSLAMAFTLSCSDGGGDGGGGGSGTFTEVFAIKEITSDSFTYVEEESYDCQSDGTLKKREYTEKGTYSIAGNVLTLKWEDWSDAAEYNFNGNSSGLIGTWTRNKNKAANCREDEDYDRVWCDYLYDVTKAVFTQNSISITADICWTDQFKDGNVRRGWTVKVIDCNNFEERKGNETVKTNFKFSGNSAKLTYTYNGKSCERSWSEPSLAARQKACADAVKQAAADGGYYEDYYEDILYSRDKNFEKCLTDNNFPEDLFGVNHEHEDEFDPSRDSEGSVMLKKKVRR